MPLSHAVYSINDATPTMVTVPGQESNSGITLMVQNVGSVPVYVGAAGLTSSSYGASIPAGGSLSIDNIFTTDEVYALSSSGTTTVSVLKVNR